MKLPTAVAVALVLVSFHGYAGTVMFDLNTVYSGTAPASSNSPWLRATFTDVTGGVQVKMKTTNLTATEFASKWGFSINPLVNISNLTITYRSGERAKSTASGVDCCKLGGVNHDLLFQFETANRPARFMQNEYSEYLLAGIVGLKATDFGKPVMAHIQSIGAQGNSGWIAVGSTPSTPNAVPEPHSWLLFGTMLGGLAVGIRRRRVNSTAH